MSGHAMCCIEGCDREMQCPSTGTCKRCYGSMYYWKKYKSLGQVMQRKKDLQLYMHRIEAVEPSVKVTTSVSVSKKKKQKAKMLA